MGSHYFEWHHGDVHYLKQGLGDPLLLVHNLYPGASHEEFTFNVAELSRHFTVYAPDLLGFGDSSAPRRKYTAGLYIELVEDFAREVVGRPAHVVAAGLSCAYVTAAAARSSGPGGLSGGLFDRLVFVCPRSEPTGLDLPRWAAPIRHFVLTAPGMWQGNYEAAAGEYAIRQYLLQCFHQPRAVTPELVRRLHENAWRAGSVHAYASLVTGYLDYPLLVDLPRVDNPILLVWGRQARPTPVEHSVRLLALAKNCRLDVVEKAGSWVHDEQSARVDDLVVRFLTGELAEVGRARTA